MQIILTEAEYNQLKADAESAKLSLLAYQSLLAQHLELKTQYDKLLRFGVIPRKAYS